jgi:hypothetical protein
VKYDLIIARYEEDVSWIENIDSSDINIFLYNKGKEDIPILLKKPIFYKTLKNIGRDPHTYIHHIVENYDNLPEYIIFVQGNPFDHCSNLFEKISNHTTEDFLFLHSTRIIEEPIACGWEHKVFAQKREEDIFDFFYFGEVARKYLGGDAPQIFRFAPGQQFIASRDKIMCRSLEYYETILNDFNKNYLLPWMLERMWQYILKVEKYE